MLLFFALYTQYLDVMNYSVKENQSVHAYLNYCLNNLSQIKYQLYFSAFSIHALYICVNAK